MNINHPAEKAGFKNACATENCPDFIHALLTHTRRFAKYSVLMAIWASFETRLWLDLAFPMPSALFLPHVVGVTWFWNLDACQWKLGQRDYCLISFMFHYVTILCTAFVLCSFYQLFLFFFIYLFSSVKLWLIIRNNS